MSALRTIPIFSPGKRVYAREMSKLKHVARIAGGYILLVIGVAGLFLPVIPGTLLIIAGAAMLGWDLKKMKDARDRVVSWWRGEQ